MFANDKQPGRLSGPCASLPTHAGEPSTLYEAVLDGVVDGDRRRVTCRNRADVAVKGARLDAHTRGELSTRQAATAEFRLAGRAAKRDVALEPIHTTLLNRHEVALHSDVVAVHEALLAFEAVDARAAKVVELKFFGGMDIDEIALALSISAATVKRDWMVARAWLRRELGSGLPQSALATFDV